MKLVTAKEMRDIDKTAINNYGIPGVVLMENAGKSVSEKCLQILGDDYRKKRVLIFVGKGNNGGDGLVAARDLLNKGVEVRLYLLCNPRDFKGDAEINYTILKNMDCKMFTILEEKDLHRADIGLMYADLAVDAIYGTGFKGAATGVAGEVIKMLTHFKRPVISVDLPSGLEADTGKVNGPCVKADYTLTFGLPKIGLFLDPGADYAGKIEVIDISIPRKLLEADSIKQNLITSSMCSELLPKRKDTDHKGSYGHVFVVGGSLGLTGAVTLACEGALRSGAGLVTAGVPSSLNTVLEQKLTEAMTVPLPETENITIGAEAINKVLEISKKTSVLAVGPGMSTNSTVVYFLRELLTKIETPVVLDADGLNILAKILESEKNFFAKVKAPLILTPHPGEMARLLNVSVKEIQENRIEVALDYAMLSKAIVVLKGSKTVIACPDRELYLNVTGNPGMATGGSGDVLTGIIASFIAQGVQNKDAAILGVYLHGLAGDLAASEKGKFAMTALDIIKYLPNAIKKIEKKYKNKYSNVVF